MPYKGGITGPEIPIVVAAAYNPREASRCPRSWWIMAKRRKQGTRSWQNIYFEVPVGLGGERVGGRSGLMDRLKEF